MVSALIILSNGAEDIEFATVADVLTRAGVQVTVGGLQGNDIVKCANCLQVKPDIALSGVQSKLFDVVVMPGGLEGSKEMEKSPLVKTILQNHSTANKYIAAICAAPINLESHKIYCGKRFTCYPGFEKCLPNHTYCTEKVVVDGKLITSRGPGTAFPFAMMIVKLLVGEIGRAHV